MYTCCNHVIGRNLVHAIQMYLDYILTMKDLGGDKYLYLKQVRNIPINEHLLTPNDYLSDLRRVFEKDNKGKTSKKPKMKMKGKKKT